MRRLTPKDGYEDAALSAFHVIRWRRELAGRGILIATLDTKRDGPTKSILGLGVAGNDTRFFQFR